MKKLIVVADWAGEALSSQEFISTVEGNLRRDNSPNIRLVETTPSTVHVGYILAQIVEITERHGHAQDVVIFQNCDARERIEGMDGKGGDFYIIKLQSGLLICGPNAGYNFGFIKTKIAQVLTYKGVEKQTQFRSRDVYARVIAHLMDNLDEEMQFDEVDNAHIPVVREHFVGHIDNFGNIKTTLTVEDFKGKFEYGDFVEIELNGVRKKAIFTEKLFGKVKDKLIIYPGSSGRQDNAYLEIAVWRDFGATELSSGQLVFGNPRPGQEILVSNL